MDTAASLIKQIDFSEAAKQLRSGVKSANPVLLTDIDRIFSLFRACEYESCLKLCDVALDYLWEKLNTGLWQSVEDSWRHIYYCLSYLKASCQYLTDEASISSAVYACDLGILLGVKPLYWRWNLTDLAASLQKLSAQRQFENADDIKTEADLTGTQNKKARMETPIPDLTEHNCIERVHQPSIESFCKNYLSTDTPIIITGCMEHWPAFTKWNLQYFKEKAGLRTVPVEIGSKYTDDNWSQQLLTITYFIDHYIQPSEQALGPACDKGYLAQHQLFDQLPELRDDILIPEYCSVGDDTEPDINAWFGPQGTISPLHQDPKSNLLCQVVGRKYVKLCDHKLTNRLYPHEGLITNTSQIDAENVDTQAYPLAKDLPFIHAVLNPGEMLFIPVKYWHYIRSLDISFSVSFWWK